MDKDTFFNTEYNHPIDTQDNKIIIEVCTDEINWIKEGKLNFASRCWIDVEDIIQALQLKGEHIDGYGSMIIGNELLLNNHDAMFEESDKNEKGFCNIIGFATVNNEGLVRFTQIVYSFLFEKIIIRDNINLKLPFKPNLELDFGGKRATYRIGSILSLRTNMDVYSKVNKKYWQSDRKKNDTSYPRLQLLTN